MAFTKTQRANGYGKRDRYGNNTKNVFCKAKQSKNGTWGYKGYFEINGRLYSIYFTGNGTQDKNGNDGSWCALVEYNNGANRF